MDELLLPLTPRWHTSTLRMTRLCLLAAAFVIAGVHGQDIRLPLNAATFFNSQNMPNPPILALPSAPTISITFAMCSGSTSAPPKLTLTNDTALSDPRSATGDNAFHISVDLGIGSWTGIMNGGGFLAVENSGQASFEIGVSNSSASSWHL